MDKEKRKEELLQLQKASTLFDKIINYTLESVKNWDVKEGIELIIDLSYTSKEFDDLTISFYLQLIKKLFNLYVKESDRVGVFDVTSFVKDLVDIKSDIDNTIQNES